MEHRQKGFHGSQVMIFRVDFTNSADVRPIFANNIHAKEGWRTDGRDFLLQEHWTSEDLTPVGLHHSIMSTIHNKHAKRQKLYLRLIDEYIVTASMS